MNRRRAILIWVALALVVAVPIIAATMSPQLAWRSPIYIAAGFAGIVAMSLLLIQPLLAGGHLPSLPAPKGRRNHRLVGLALVSAVAIHVAALWQTSPPDVIDALLFVSPTPFSAWGVVAMWTVFASALLAAFRKRLGLRPKTWRLGHTALAGITVIGSVVHAILIEGTMETMSKFALCALVIIATAKVIYDLKIWTFKPRPKNGSPS